MIKISRFFKRLPGLTAADFSALWQSGYGEALQALAADSAGVSRYAQSLPAIQGLSHGSRLQSLEGMEWVVSVIRGWQSI